MPPEISPNNKASGLLRLIAGLDRLVESTGRPLGWLNLFIVLITCLVVALRYGLNHSSIPLQEAAMYLHAAAFMLGSAWALQRNAHVRVDIFYQRFSPRARAIVDLSGTLVFTLPLMAFLAWSSWGYVSSAWSIHEVSQEAHGLPLVYVLKTLIPALALLVSLQALAEVLRNIAILQGRLQPPALHGHQP